MLSIRLKRMGAKKKPFYRLVVSDTRKRPTGSFIDSLGYYNPLTDPPQVKIDAEKAEAWIQKGAKTSKTVQSLLAKAATAGGEQS